MFKYSNTEEKASLVVLAGIVGRLNVGVYNP